MKLRYVLIPLSLNLLLAWLILGCGTVHPQPTPTPVVDAGPAPDSPPTPPPVDYVVVCQHLAAIGCPEGADPLCADSLQSVASGRMIPIDLTCLAKAPDKAVARACGPAVACP